MLLGPASAPVKQSLCAAGTTTVVATVIAGDVRATATAGDADDGGCAAVKQSSCAAGTITVAANVIAGNVGATTTAGDAVDGDQGASGVVKFHRRLAAFTCVYGTCFALFS